MTKPASAARPSSQPGKPDEDRAAGRQLHQHSLARPLLVRPVGCAPITLVLAGRRRERLAAIARASRILAEGSSVSIETAGAGCLERRDAVLIQFRVGGYPRAGAMKLFRWSSISAAMRASAPEDWRQPGARGPSCATSLRYFPNLPAAHVILLTSPLTTLVKVSRLAFPQLDVTGICELPFTTLRVGLPGKGSTGTTSVSTTSVGSSFRCSPRPVEVPSSP